MPPNIFSYVLEQRLKRFLKTWRERKTHSFLAKYMRYYILTRQERLGDAVQCEVLSPQSDRLLCCDPTVRRRSNSALCCTRRRPHNTLQKSSTAHSLQVTHTQCTFLNNYFITIIVILKYKGDQALTVCFDTPLYLCINREQMVLNSIVFHCKLIEQTD